MTFINKSNQYHIGVIICSLLGIIWVLSVENFGGYILLLFFFLPIYSVLNHIKSKSIKAFLIAGELLWITFISFVGFWFEYYKMGEYLFPLFLLLINILFRLISFANLYTYKNKMLVAISLSILIPILIYWYGTTDHLSIGF